MQLIELVVQYPWKMGGLFKMYRRIYRKYFLTNMLQLISQLPSMLQYEVVFIYRDVK